MLSTQGSNDSPRSKTSTPSVYSLSGGKSPCNVRSTRYLRNRLRLGALAKAELRRIRPNWRRTDSSKAVLSSAVSPFGDSFRTDTRTSEHTQLYTGESCSVYVVFTSIYLSSWPERQTMNPCDSTARAGAPGISARRQVVRD